MTLSNELLAAALTGLEAQRQRLDAQIAEVRALMGKRGPGRPPRSAMPTMDDWESPARSVPAKRKRRKRKLSPEGRAAIIAAVKKRWAKAKKKAA
jgi:hypothetical protein